MIDFDGIDGFDDQVSALENSLQDATAFTRAFTGELTRMGATVDTLGTDVSALSSGFSRGIKGAIDGLVDGSSTLGDALRGLRQSMLDTVYNAAVTMSAGSCPRRSAGCSTPSCRWPMAAPSARAG